MKTIGEIIKNANRPNKLKNISLGSIFYIANDTRKIIFSILCLKKIVTPTGAIYMGVNLSSQNILESDSENVSLRAYYPAEIITQHMLKQYIEKHYTVMELSINKKIVEPDVKIETKTDFTLMGRLKNVSRT